MIVERSISLGDTLQHYVKFAYKTFVVDNYVLEDPSEVDEVLKGEYVYKNSKLFKALKNTVSSLNNLKDENIFLEIPAYYDETPKIKKDEISKNIQSSEATKSEKIEKVEAVEKTEETAPVVNDVKSKKKH